MVRLWGDPIILHFHTLIPKKVAIGQPSPFSDATVDLKLWRHQNLRVHQKPKTSRWFGLGWVVWVFETWKARRRRKMGEVEMNSCSYTDAGVEENCFLVMNLGHGTWSLRIVTFIWVIFYGSFPSNPWWIQFVHVKQRFQKMLANRQWLKQCAILWTSDCGTAEEIGGNMILSEIPTIDKLIDVFSRRMASMLHQFGAQQGCKQ